MLKLRMEYIAAEEKKQCVNRKLKKLKKKFGKFRYIIPYYYILKVRHKLLKIRLKNITKKGN